jgi:hypothetical protein
VPCTSKGLNCLLPAGSAAERERAARIAAAIPGAVACRRWASTRTRRATGRGAHRDRRRHRPGASRGGAGAADRWRCFCASDPALTGVLAGTPAINLAHAASRPSRSMSSPQRSGPCSDGALPLHPRAIALLPWAVLHLLWRSRAGSPSTCGTGANASVVSAPPAGAGADDLAARRIGRRDAGRAAAGGGLARTLSPGTASCSPT